MPIHIICIYVYTVYRMRQKQTEWNETKNLNNNAFVHCCICLEPFGMHYLFFFYNELFSTIS